MIPDEKPRLYDVAVDKESVMKRIFGTSVAFLLFISMTFSAPAPFSKPGRSMEQYTVDELTKELRERGMDVAEVKRIGPKDWVVKFTATRAQGGCLTGVLGKQFSSRVEAKDGAGALRVLLKSCREEDEQRERRLRALGLIP